MKLDKQQQENLLRKLDDLWPQPRKCPVCANSSWETTDTVFETREFAGSGFSTRVQIYPTIFVLCDRCGYSMAMNAIKLGILDNDKDVK
ncbi:MAG: hypothetical protein M5R36_14655 [Deltaproteobacteria bacterium]|nr:hypothetical protein [Deltaproteobacteria bacterium]